MRKGIAIARSSGRMLHRGELKCNRSGQRVCVSSRVETVGGTQHPAARQPLPTGPYLALFLARSQP